MLASTTLVIRTLIALSRANWILLWAAIELNLLRFIPIILQSKRNQETEGSIKYFLAQAVGSALLLITRSSLWIPFSSVPNLIPTILIVAILLKLGRVPCHFWYPSVISSISWLSCLILSTWQKLAPLSILAFLIQQKSPHVIITIAGLNAIIGGIIGINQRQIRTIMAYSSIGHIGWMLSLLSVYKPYTSITYFIIYSLLIFPIFIYIKYYNIYSSKQINKVHLGRTTSLLAAAILLLSLGGLPPLTGFIPKLMVISTLRESIKPVVIILILGSVINLFFYLNIAINLIIPSFNTKGRDKYSKSSLNIISVTAATVSLGIRPIIII